MTYFVTVMSHWTNSGNWLKKYTNLNSREQGHVKYSNLRWHSRTIQLKPWDLWHNWNPSSTTPPTVFFSFVIHSNDLLHFDILNVQKNGMIVTLVFSRLAFHQFSMLKDSHPWVKAFINSEQNRPSILLQLPFSLFNPSFDILQDIANLFCDFLIPFPSSLWAVVSTFTAKLFVHFPSKSGSNW